MFTPTHPSPFLRDVPHFYTSTSFEPPPRLDAPVLPQDWVSFNTLAASSDGEFDTFRKTPLFELAKQQFLERIAQCEQFAHAHFTREERLSILDGLAKFRGRLLVGDGDTYFGHTLSQLYGSGKRHFDTFCLRLQQDIDLHQRKAALRELASELHNCRSTGPAFHDAALALDRAPGGLHGEFHELLMQRIDALLREVVNRPMRGVPQTPENVTKRLKRLERMEVHMVNRLKVELDLPNVGALDRFMGASNLVETYQIDEAKDLLKAELRPVLLARDLADRYMMQLRSKLTAQVLAPGAVLGDHMAAIEQAQRAVNATFGPVSLHSILTMDVDTGECQWQEDLSLLALDLLESLAQQNLIVPQPCSSVLRDGSKDGLWDLMQVDWRLFLVEQRTTPTAPAEKTPVRMHHALKLMNQLPMQPPPAALTTAVLTDKPENWREMPISWLTTEAHLDRFCRFHGDAHIQTLLELEGPLDCSYLSILLPTLTDLSMWRSLSAVFKAENNHPECCVRDSGGQRMLLRALTHSCDQTRRQWLKTFMEAVPKSSADEVKAWFELPTQRTRRVLTTASFGAMLDYLHLVSAAHDKAGFEARKLHDLLDIDIQAMMKEGNFDTLKAYVEQLGALHLRGTVSVDSLFTLLDGEDRQGCSGALEVGSKEVVEWYDKHVLHLHGQNVLTARRVASLLSCRPPCQDSGAVKAIRNGHADALSAHFTQWHRAFEMKVISPEQLAELLACRDARGRSGLFTMLEQSGLQPCLAPWRQAIVEAARTKRLPESEVMGLLAPRTEDGRHLLLTLFDGAGGVQRGKSWLAEASRVRDAGVLRPQAMTSLLDGYPRDIDKSENSLLLEAMQSSESPDNVTQLLELMGFAYKRYKLSEGELAQLLIPLQDPESSPRPTALKKLLSLSAHWRAMVEGLLALGEAGHLDGAPLLTLLHAIARLRLSSVSVLAESDLQRFIEKLLATDVATADQQRVQGRRWGELLLNCDEPRAATSGSREDAVAILKLLENAVMQAEQRRMISSAGMAQYLEEIRQLHETHGQAHPPQKPRKPQPLPRFQKSTAPVVQGSAQPSSSTRMPPPVAPRPPRPGPSAAGASGGASGGASRGAAGVSTAAFHTRF